MHEIRVKLVPKITYPVKFIILNSKILRIVKAIKLEEISALQRTIKIDLSREYFSFFFKTYISKITFIHAATDVDIAKPTCKKSLIKTKFRIKFIAIQAKEILIGVFVFSLAKKGTTRILIIINAGNPKHKATKAELVNRTSSAWKAPLKNRSEIISSENTNNPLNAGMENTIPNLIALEILILEEYQL